MLEEFYRFESVLARIQDSRFSADLEDLAKNLKKSGHRLLPGYMRCARHLTYCIESGQLPLDGLTADGIRRFARQHLGHCSCPPPRSMGCNFVSVAPHLFEAMRERHGLSSAVERDDVTPVDAVLRAFDAHLRNDRGFRDSTRARYLQDMRRLLVARCGAGDVEMSLWTAQDVRDCFASRAAMSTHAAKHLASAFKAFLRFVALRGGSVAHLIEAIPPMSLPRLAGLPRGLSDEQLAQLLKSVDVSRAIGLRARAIIECLASLGLRAGEVAALRLEDIDWRAGTLRINRSKMRRSDVLPLPQTVGRALVAYLKRGRPKTADHHVFVRHLCPAGAPLRYYSISETVHSALQRAGISLPSMGAHALRHAAAGRLVRAGVSIKRIADVLRHRDVDTTRIYAKVDWPRLAEVALPWPTVVVS
jgi:site-specific recombinase XerD